MSAQDGVLLREGAIFVDEYRVGRLLLHGSSGREMYLAKELATGRTLTISCAPDFAPLSARRFEERIEALVRFRHPVSAAFYKGGIAERMPWIVGEHVEGQTLRRCLSLEQPVRFSVALVYAAYIAEALMVAHAHGIRHGRLSPSKVVFLTRWPGVQMLGLGLEQLFGRAVNVASDVRSLGALLYAMISGVTIRDDKPAPLSWVARDVPRHVCDVVDRAVSKDSLVRFRTMTDLVSALQTLHVHSPELRAELAGAVGTAFKRLGREGEEPEVPEGPPQKLQRRRPGTSVGAYRTRRRMARTNFVAEAHPRTKAPESAAASTPVLPTPLSPYTAQVAAALKAMIAEMKKPYDDAGANRADEPILPGVPDPEVAEALKTIAATLKWPGVDDADALAAEAPVSPATREGTADEAPQDAPRGIEPVEPVEPTVDMARGKAPEASSRPDPSVPSTMPSARFTPPGHVEVSSLAFSSPSEAAPSTPAPDAARAPLLRPPPLEVDVVAAPRRSLLRRMGCSLAVLVASSALAAVATLGRSTSDERPPRARSFEPPARLPELPPALKQKPPEPMLDGRSPPRVPVMPPRRATPPSPSPPPSPSVSSGLPKECRSKYFECYREELGR